MQSRCSDPQSGSAAHLEDLGASLEPHSLAELNAAVLLQHLGEDAAVQQSSTGERRQHSVACDMKRQARAAWPIRCTQRRHPQRRSPAQRAEHGPACVDDLNGAVALEGLGVGGQAGGVPAVVAGELACGRARAQQGGLGWSATRQAEGAARTGGVPASQFARARRAGGKSTQHTGGWCRMDAATRRAKPNMGRLAPAAAAPPSQETCALIYDSLCGNRFPFARAVRTGQVGGHQTLREGAQELGAVGACRWKQHTMAAT